MTTRLADELGQKACALLDALGPGVATLERLRNRMLSGELGPERNRLTGNITVPGPGDVERLPPPGVVRTNLYERGIDAIRAGQVGIVLLNGGMATRFGGVVKGAVEVGAGRSFLGLKIRDTIRRSGARVPILLMNSQATAAATCEHLARNNRFGVDSATIDMFSQQWLPRLNADGSAYRDPDGALSLYGPGHGDLPTCLRRSGALARFVDAGGRWLLMSNVDNVLATLDPVMVGWHIERGVSITAEVVEKYDGDAGGAPARVDGHLQIVEDFRFPAGFDSVAIPVFNTNTFWFDVRAFAEEPPLTWFVVRKQVNGVNVIQFERLVGEMTAFADSAFLHVERAGANSRFMPVKNPRDLELGRAEIMGLWLNR